MQITIKTGPCNISNAFKKHYCVDIQLLESPDLTQPHIFVYLSLAQLAIFDQNLFNLKPCSHLHV